MKHILSLITAITLLASQAYADAVTADALRQAGMPNEQAVLVAGTLNGAGYVSVTSAKITFAGATATSNAIVTGSADATDSNSLNLTGGGAVATDGSRGAALFLRGNEFTSTGGSISAVAGDTSTANINLSIENASSNVIIKDNTTGALWTFTDAGTLTADGTNGGNIVMQKAATGAIIGESTRAANVTTATTLAVPLYVSAAASGTDLAAFIGSGVSASGPVIDFFKTRATSGAATTIVNSADKTGTIRFLGSNGTTYDVSAQIVGTIDATPGASADMPGAIDFQISPDGSATPASVLKLNNAKLATFTGQITSTATSDLGWALVSGANTACNTTCTSACVFGQNTANFAIVACTDATADVCVCAGAS